MEEEFRTDIIFLAIPSRVVVTRLERRNTLALPVVGRRTGRKDNRERGPQ